MALTARGLPWTVRVHTAAVGPVGNARVVVCGIGMALVGCQNGFFGGLASKISATEFGLALGPNIKPKAPGMLREGVRRT